MPSWKLYLLLQGLCCPWACRVCARGQLRVGTPSEAFFPCRLSLVELGGIALSLWLALEPGAATGYIMKQLGLTPGTMGADLMAVTASADFTEHLQAVGHP